MYGVWWGVLSTVHCDVQRVMGRAKCCSLWCTVCDGAFYVLFIVMCSVWWGVLSTVLYDVRCVMGHSTYSSLWCAACDDGWALYDGACYKFFTELLEFSEAQKVCGGHTALVTSMIDEAEQNFTSSLRCFSFFCSHAYHIFRFLTQEKSGIVSLLDFLISSVWIIDSHLSWSRLLSFLHHLQSLLCIIY